MFYRALGRAGFSVSILGYGTWPFAAYPWGPCDLREAQRALHTGISLGVNFIDTAAAYEGVEELVGSVLRASRRAERVAIATKIPPCYPDIPPPLLHAQHAYPGEYLRAAVERSLVRLKIERVTLLQLHTWASRWLTEGDWLETLLELRREGKIALIGISVMDRNASSATAAAASGVIDAVQVMYNVSVQEAASELLPVCERAGVGVIVRSPLFEGALAGSLRRFSATDWCRFPRSVVNHRPLPPGLRHRWTC